MKFEPLERGGVVDITVNNCQLSQTGLNYVGYGAGVRAHFPGSRFVTLSFPTRGSGSTVIAGTERLLGPRRGLVMPADAGFAANLNADFEHVVLRLDPRLWRTSWRRSSARRSTGRCSSIRCWSFPASTPDCCAVIFSFWSIW